ncbi:MAG: pantetheine-phosphate adenylyltransferase [Candidatus Nealsonbacteria bacterium]
MKKSSKKVVIGGTFDVLHQGHKFLIRKAFSLGRVTIGLTSDSMAKKTRNRNVKSFKLRKKELEKFIKSTFSDKARIEKINDRGGVALKEDFDYIVVSPATVSGAEEINRKRKKLGKKTINIVKIKFVLGKDKKPISATKILSFNKEEIVRKLKSLANKKNVEGMARFGINPKKSKVLGVSVYVIRDMAKKIGKNHKLAQQLWNSKIHEARWLAGFIEDPSLVTEEQIEKWVKDFDSWAVCDTVCSALFWKTKFAKKKIFEWSRRKEEFVKRTSFVLMAVLSVHDKAAKDSDFEKFFPLIKKHSVDERNFVKKAVNWALRQIGKRSLGLNKKALVVAKDIEKMDSRSAKWIAKDAIRELEAKRRELF